ncbi:MAG: hypothetical protein HUU50_04770 [Candidatus Brocadiae bacterium]|nr:hypothetical protein [Candidatus Brocadiia bacterium]
MDNPAKRSKVYIIEETEHKEKVAAPPNAFSWFICEEIWDKLPQDFLDD